MSLDFATDEYDSNDNCDESYLNDNDGNDTDENDNENENDNDNDDKNDNENESQNESQTSKKSKKRKIKTKKLSLTEALKTVEERSLYTKVDKFFRKECPQKDKDKMVKIINNEDELSLRFLNWVGMKHSATMPALEITNDDGTVTYSDVKISYKARLDTHSKKYFDPFRRGARFDYQYDTNDPTKTVETTLCQLNYFRWIITLGLLKYIEEHEDQLKNKMSTFNASEKKKKEVKKENAKKKTIKKKKQELKIKVKRFTEENTSKLVIFV
jgi:hypothetical protein